MGRITDGLKLPFVRAGVGPAWWRRPEVWLLLACVGLSLLKLYLLEVNSREILECRWCLAGKGLSHELEFDLLIVALYLLSGIPNWRPVRLAIRLIVIGLLLITAVDLVLLRLFLMRFSADELIKFISEAGAIESFLRQLVSGLGTSLLIGSGGLLALAGLARFWWAEPSVGRSTWLVLAPAALALLINLTLRPDYHSDYLKNSTEAFFSFQTRERNYSAAYARAIAAQPPPERFCASGLGQRKDVILLVVESLSVYHSRLFSGLHDWTPEFDALAAQGLRLSNFYANGIDTEEGLISLLTGEPPLARGDAKTVLASFAQPAQTLPRVFAAEGYRTAFLTTGDLSFLDKGHWLKGLGYEFVEGHDAAYYDGMKRFHFNAAPDQALYGRALEFMEAQAAHVAPLFLTLETVSTHHPYVDPVSGSRSQEAVFRYADQQIGRFVRELRARGYFEHGMLMIVGDHRAMMPMGSDELARFGDSAYARVPFIAIGGGIAPREETTRLSQNDVLPSLQHWVGQGRACVGVNQGLFLPALVRAPLCTYTLRRYNLNDVFLACRDSQPQVHLDGDRTRYAGWSGGPAWQLNEVNRLRVGAGF